MAEDTARRFYHLGSGDEFEGPFTVAEIRERIRAGTIQPDALLQLEGSMAKVPAGDLPELKPTPTEAPLFFYAREGDTVGPFTANEIRYFFKDGLIKPGDHVLQQGASAWVPISQVPDLMAPPVANPAPPAHPASPAPAKPAAGAAVAAPVTSLKRVPYTPGQQPRNPGLYLVFGHAPADLVAFLGRFGQRWQASESQRRRARRFFVPVLLALGFGACAVDVSMEFRQPVFSVLAPFSGLGAILVLVATRRRTRAAPADDERFAACRDLVEALAGDVMRGKTVSGWLDLTGPEQDVKMTARGHTPRGAAVAAYRDEWLRLRLPLRDGNQLRISAVERRKVKSPRRSRRRTKPGATRSLSTVEIRLAVNPAAYRVLATERKAAAFGGLSLAGLDVSPGSISAVAASQQPRFQARAVLSILALVYKQLEPLKASPPVSGG